MLYRLALSAAATAIALAAQQPVQVVDSQAGQARFEQQFGPDWTVWQGPYGVPFRVFGPGAQVLPAPGVQTAADARRAVARVVELHGAWLGVSPAAIRETHFGEGNLILSLAYQQLSGGVPVWNAYLKFTFNRGDGGLAIFGSEAIPGLTVDMAATLDRDAAVAQFGKLASWKPADGPMHHEPHLEIAPDQNDVYRLTWKVTAEFLDRPEAWSLWIDAKTGAEIKRESQIHYCGLGAHACSAHAATPAPAPAAAPLIGNVSGWISPKGGGLAAINPPQLLPMANIRVDVPGVGFVFTDASGNFSIPFAGTTPQNGTVGLASGRWWSTVTDDSATAIQSQPVTLTPGVASNIIFNAAPTEFLTAQVNAVQYTGEIHDYVKGVVPTMTAIDPAVTVRVNINQSCNAYFSGSSINFYRLSGSCNNTATASVVAHEYGHSVDARNGGIGSTPRTPSEGIGDVHSIYLQDNPDIGTDFYQTSRPGIRNGNNTLTHPLTGSSQAVHTFGQPYMAWAWRLLTEARATYGPLVGYQIAESAVFESILTNPRDMLDCILDAYEADDNDSNLNNGTPHIDVLAKASLLKHFIRPVFHPIQFTHTPLADQSSGAGGFTIDADVTTTIGTLSTVTLSFDPGTGAFSSIPMANVGGNTWRATTPAVSPRRLARYSISATNSTGNTNRLPAEVGDSFVVAVGQKTTVFSESFEAANANWTFGTGWSRHTPIGRNYDPNAAAAGTFVAGTNRSATDERMPTATGTQSLTSIGINTTGRFGLRLRFKRWSTNANGGACTVLVGGVAVQTAATPNDQAWKTFDLDVAAQADNRASVAIQFTNATTQSDGVGGATIDGVELYALNTQCPALATYSPGLAGVNGIPSLTANGEPRIGNAAYALNLGSAAPTAGIAWIVGLSTANIPAFGGIIAVAPLLVVGAGTNAAGTAALTLSVPNDPLLVGGSLFIQTVVADAAAVQGVALSPAVRTVVCTQP